MKKKLYFGTNLKMYKNIRETVQYLKELEEKTAALNREENTLFVIPSYTSLPDAAKSISQTNILLGAQNMGWEEKGQFTGEISPLMLEEIGISLVMAGHSERRHIFKETDEEENKKVLCALDHGFQALLCIGETMEEKEAGISNEALRIQLIKGLKHVDPKKLSQIWVAYEPVWAIGVNGKPASSSYAGEKHGVIKDCLEELFGPAGRDIPALYGGSVNPQNANALIAEPCIDGLFVGRSAWEAQNFAPLIFDAIAAARGK